MFKPLAPKILAALLCTSVLTSGILFTRAIEKILSSSPTWQVFLEKTAYARSSGGRSGGGSFSKPSSAPSRSSSGSSSSKRSSTPSRRSSESRSRNNSRSTPRRQNNSPSTSPSRVTPPPSTTIVPVPVQQAPSVNPRTSVPITPPPSTTIVPVPVQQAPSVNPRTSVPVTPPPSTTIVPLPAQQAPSVPSTTYTNTTTVYPENSVNIWPWVLGGTAVAGVVGLILYDSQKSSQSSGGTSVEQERDNDTVTISRLQEALLATASGVQSALTQLSLAVDTETAEGLLELLQESVLVLLRHSEYWSHGFVSSESVSIDDAEQKFNALSMQERSNFSQETLSHVHGNLRQRSFHAPENEQADYIVVTLLLGTADDQPLFTSVYTPDELKGALERLSAIRGDYLMKFELLWSPQAENDSLTYDELLTEYTHLVQLG